MSNCFGISKKSYYLILETLAEFSEIKKAVIFGSRAKGNARKGSDIDIAIFGEALTPKTAMDLSSKLNEVLPIPYRVDVVAPLLSDHPDLLDHIARVGMTIYQQLAHD